jgi:nickel/cobalt exporter
VLAGDVLILLTSALLLGFLHGLGADHLTAIAALSLAPGERTPAAQRARAIGVAMRFAVGHALLLTLGAGALIGLGWSIPVVVDRGGELMGGVLLIVLGAIALWGIGVGRVYGHSHLHGREPAPHWHLHIGRRDHHPHAGAHSHLPTIIGAAFAVSSLRALALLAPFGGHAIARPLPLMLGLIAVFAAGILLSMSLFGVALARLMTARVVMRLGHGAAGLMGIASIALGVFWILR